MELTHIQLFIKMSRQSVLSFDIAYYTLKKERKNLSGKELKSADVMWAENQGAVCLTAAPVPTGISAKFCEHVCVCLLMECGFAVGSNVV